MQNLKVGTGLAPKNLTVLGNSSIAGNLGVIGVTTLGDDLNVGSAGLQESGFNNDLHVYGDASVTGDFIVGDTDVIATINAKAPTANPSLEGIVSANTIDTVPNANNVKPNLYVLHTLSVGTGAPAKNLIVSGNTSLAGNLGVLGVTTT